MEVREEFETGVSARHNRWTSVRMKCNVPCNKSQLVCTPANKPQMQCIMQFPYAPRHYSGKSDLSSTGPPAMQ